MAATDLVIQQTAATILVVEDEFLIRCMLSQIMRDEGYNVLEAANADDALEIIRAGGSLDLVFSDVRMPGSLDGLGLLLAIQAIKPNFPVVITSGHCPEAAALQGGAVRFVAKPYDIHAVVSLVGDILTGLA